MAAKSRQLHIFLLSSLIAVSVISVSPLKALGAGKADDVFVDEGDGDFDSAPVPKKQTFSKTDKAVSPKEKAATPPPMPAVEAAAPVAPARAEAPTATDVVVPEKELTEAPSASPETGKEVSDDTPALKETPQAATEAATEAATGAPSNQLPSVPAPSAAAPMGLPKKVHAQKDSQKDSQKQASESTPHQHHKMTKKEAGIYVVTNGPCTMNRAPASESEAMITVKPSKKIWVQEVDDKWLRAFNKAGEAGYIARDCVQETK